MYYLQMPQVSLTGRRYSLDLPNRAYCGVIPANNLIVDSKRFLDNIDDEHKYKYLVRGKESYSGVNLRNVCSITVP